MLVVGAIGARARRDAGFLRLSSVGSGRVGSRRPPGCPVADRRGLRPLCRCLGLSLCAARVRSLSFPSSVIGLAAERPEGEGCDAG